MQDKQYDPARHNEKSPAEGMAAVNTHNPDEQEYEKTGNQVTKDEKETLEKEEHNKIKQKD